MDQRMFYQIAVAEAKEGEMAMVTCISGEQTGSKALFHEGGLLTAIPREAGAFFQQVSLPEDGFCGVFEGPEGSRLFCDPLVPEPKLIIVGAGHVGQALAKLGCECGFTVFVVDERRELLTEERFPGCVLLDSYSGGLMPFSGGNCYFAVMAQDHATSEQCLLTIMRRRYAYVGMLGAQSRWPQTEQLLKEAEIPEEKIKDLVLPIGMEIGAETPQEIAVSVMAQLIARRRELTGSVACYIPIYQALAQSQEPQVLATLVNTRGTTSRHQGAKLCLKADGSLLGSVGGGAVEAEALEAMRQTQNDGQPRLVSAVSDSQGQAEIFVERI